ncbi:MAG TPA: hypothetical protein ENG39_01065 [Candidatus Omnitrophica bacterium]|nr:hypothetical protein [Candidatus Omnitrophota bacterium]
MSRHPSLKIKTQAQQRNVLKRFERVAMVINSGEDEVNVFKLPKYKRKRLKAAKHVAKEEREEQKTETTQGNV